jgi:hypothetical protein
MLNLNALLPSESEEEEPASPMVRLGSSPDLSWCYWFFLRVALFD